MYISSNCPQNGWVTSWRTNEKRLSSRSSYMFSFVPVKRLSKAVTS